MKKVAVIGGMGNMGRRYALILEKFCNCEVVPWDIKMRMPSVDFNSCDGFIIATPTETHYALIKAFMQYGKPILSEKPVVKHEKLLKQLIEIDGLDLSMINQYSFLVNDDDKGNTYYNYFKTGNDGLLWDCMNIIGLAKTSHDIANNSLVWKCAINGKELSIADMDQAYINNIVAWTQGWRNKEYMINAHDKIWRVLNEK